MFKRIRKTLRNPRVWIPLVTVLAVLVLAGGTFLIFRSWPLAMVIALAVVLVALVVVLLRTLFRQEREDRIERGIDDRDRYDEAQRLQARAGALGSLDERFRRALDEIRRSRLGAEGLYELPWLLVLGETGAGKSEALRQSGLELPAEYAHLLRGGPTQDCDWWLTNQAIVLDTAGHFLEENEDAARGWRRLLTLLRRNRTRMPLEGLVVAIPAPSLLSSGAEELSQRAHTLRRRINELSDTLRVDVPIYVLVTKADQIEGFSETISALGPAHVREAFGWTHDRRSFADAGERVLDGMEQIIQRLELLVPEMVMRESDPRRRRRIFLFPEELRETSQALASFLRAAFAPSVYDEVPFLRGVYLVSARREGTTLSPVLRRLGQEWARSTLGPDAAPPGGLFLHDVFREIIIGDRDLALPSHWLGPGTRRIIVGTLAAVSLAAILVLGIAFVDNLGAVRRLASESGAVVAGASSLASIERLRAAIASREAEPFPAGGLGLNQATGRALHRARQTFAWAFGREFEQPTKTRLIGTARSYEHDAFEALAELGLDVAWLATRADESQAAPPDLLPYAPVGRNEADVSAFRAGYDAFVRWMPDEQVRSRVERERDALVAAAPRLLDITRLEEWSESSAETRPPVRYADLGIPVDENDASTYVTGAYTRRTWETLVKDLIESVERSGGASSESVASFREGYIERYDRKWRNFLVDTPVDPYADAGVKDSPYIRLVETIDDNLQAELPRSIAPPQYIGALREARREVPTPAEVEAQKRAPWQSYQAALDQVEADVVAARAQGERALDVAMNMTQPDRTSFQSAIQFVRNTVPIEGDTQATAKLQEVLSMPFLNGASAVLERALEELERRWVERIAGPFSGALDTQRLEALYRPEGGELARFEQDALGSFYADGRAVPILGDRAMPFGKGFIEWMRSAENLRRSLFPGFGASPEIAVRLEGIPSRVVGGGGWFVTRRDLRVACAESVETFVYREGTGSQGFSWTPDCQQVTLRIFARGPGGTERELRPRQERTGPLAFPQFLQSAQRLPGGRLQWRIQYDDPPLEVLVEYRLRGGEGVLNVAHRPPPRSLRE
jgi:type VI protein secretion system component VasK